MKKTNAARILDRNKVSYDISTYEVDENDLGAVNVASKINADIKKVFKTLVVRGNNGIVVASIPGDSDLNLKALASASGNKKVNLVPLKEINSLTGYIRGGVSPIGMKKQYSFFLDASAKNYDKIYISAGLRGMQFFINPDDLLLVTKGTLCKLTD
ncbi:Cys-tRNA(Pro) deacylase [Clostridiaceae bacterium M8S5]|nr:Cys-tRNA(Pro) deacylase [Clostridiaceae bacterium M8S5]